MHDETQEPTEEELRAALEEQMRHIRVEDVILQTVATLVNLAARRLGLTTPPGEEPTEERDAEQARLAIEAVRALVPLSPDEQMASLRQALTQLQMAYARETQAAGGTGAQPVPGPAATPPGPAEPAPGEGPGEAQGPGGADDERAKARSKIWTPPER